MSATLSQQLLLDMRTWNRTMPTILGSGSPTFNEIFWWRDGGFQYRHGMEPIEDEL